MLVQTLAHGPHDAAVCLKLLDFSLFPFGSQSGFGFDRKIRVLRVEGLFVVVDLGFASIVRSEYCGFRGCLLLLLLLL
jgi:hypothetical protein